ncbi:MAG: PAS domain S-box protein, partial [Polyangiaceae bacterium]
MDANAAFQELLGWSREELVGRTSAEIGMLRHAEERARLAGEVEKRGTAHELATTLRCRDGSDLPCLVSARTLELDGELCFITAVRDMRQRQQAERALRESEEKFSKAFHASAEAISITVASTGRFVDVNKGYEALIGYARAEVVGRTAVEIGMWVDPATRTPMMQQMQRDGFVRDYPIQIQSKDGKALEILFSADFIELGGERHIVAAARDVTEQRHAERQLR